MKHKLLSALLAISALVSSGALAQVKVSVECLSSGTKPNGTKPAKPFVEAISVESRTEKVHGKDGKPEEWGIKRSDLVSDGEKQKPTIVVATPDYAVLSNATTVGSGFERRLLVFTYMLDLKAMQLTRIVNALPTAPEELSIAKCTAK